MVIANSNLNNQTNLLPSVSYGVTSVGKLRIHESSKQKNGKVVLQQLEIDGEIVRPTRRFWRSFFTRFGIADNIFRYFSPEEVFRRIASKSDNDEFRYCIARSPKSSQLLAATSLNRPVIRCDEVADIVSNYGGTNVRYQEGLLISSHQPRGGSRQFAIGGDQFHDSFVLETPIDGYGHPKLFLSLLRLVCSNGAIGYAKAFRSDIPVGKNMDHCIVRALESFDNGDGYAALRQRFAASQSSWASVRECLTLAKTLEKSVSGLGSETHKIMSRFRAMTGYLSELYGLANLEALSDKRQRILPSQCRVYDLINFASEVATHYVSGESATQVQAYIGSLIGDEYDLEGTAEGSAEFDDFFLAS